MMGWPETIWPSLGDTRRSAARTGVTLKEHLDPRFVIIDEEVGLAETSSADCWGREGGKLAAVHLGRYGLRSGKPHKRDASAG